jgi:hypothetical protein
MTMRRVRCVSPHGGGHYGLDRNDQAAGPGYGGPLKLPPNEGGYVVSPVLGTVAVGGELDAPDPPFFIADGFHFVDAATGAGDVCETAGDGCWCGQHRVLPPPPEPPAPPASAPSLADLLSRGAR